MSGDSKGRLGKLVDRLETAMAAQEFYEAHQLYKTIYFRCISRGCYQEAADYMFQGAEFLLKNNHLESGSDLAVLLLKSREKGRLPVDDEMAQNLSRLHKLMKPGSMERSSFVSLSTELLKGRQSSGNNGDTLASFNEYLGRNLWQEANFSEARHHMVNSRNGYATGSLLIEFHMRSGYRAELELFITQTVLQCLCMEKSGMAALSFYTYTRRHPQLTEPGPPFLNFPLLNFLWFLMLAIERQQSLSVYSVLCDKYRPILSRDPCYRGYLDKIGQVYFGLPAPASPSNNILTNIMNLFGGGGDSTEDAVATALDEADGSGPPQSMEDRGGGGECSTGSSNTPLQHEDMD